MWSGLGKGKARQVYLHSTFQQKAIQSALYKTLKASRQGAKEKLNQTFTNS